MITEVIYFLNELDMLEAHLEEHQHFVDKFFIKESACLWSGLSKKLHFDENRERFSRFNIEPIVIPNSEFDLSIPSSFPEDEFKKWFDVRRNNRSNSRRYRWEDICAGCDWVMSMDCDEIVDSRKASVFLDCLKPDFEHVAVHLTQYQHWINVRGKGLKLWRVFRSDVPHRFAVRGFPRVVTPERVGGHFTNCYISAPAIRTKALGILTHYGYKGADDVPTVDEISRSLEAGVDPFRTRWSGDQSVPETVRAIAPPDQRIMPDLEHTPKFMRENPTLFPVYG